MIRSTALVYAASLLFFLSPLFGQSPDRPRKGRRGGPEARQGDEGSKKSDIKPYDEVITDETKTDAGLFYVHRKDETVYFEIPRETLDREMLWVTQIERTQSGFGYGGTSVGNRVVRWELRDKRVLLRDVKYQIRADVTDPIRNAVQGTSLAPIIKVFDIKAWGKDRLGRGRDQLPDDRQIRVRSRPVGGRRSGLRRLSRRHRGRHLPRGW